MTPQNIKSSCRNKYKTKHHLEKPNLKGHCLDGGELTSAHIFGLFSVTRRSRSGVCQSVSQSALADFTDVTLVSDVSEDLDDPNDPEGKVHKKRGKTIMKISFRYLRVAGNFEKIVFFPFFPQHTLNRQVSFTVGLLDHRRWYLDLLKGQTIWQKF